MTSVDNQQPSLLQEEGSTTMVTNSDVSNECGAVYCQLCISEKGVSKDYHLLDRHLRSVHKLTRKEYLEQFPAASTVSDSYKDNFIGKVAWNKGLTKETSTAVARNAVGTSATRRRLSSEGNLPIWNRGVSAATSGVWREVCDKAHDARKGSTPWNKGLTKETDERVSRASEKTSKTLLDRYASGLTVWNKGLDITDSRVRRNVVDGRETLRQRIAAGVIIPNDTPYYKTRFKAGFREDLGHRVRSSWEANFARILNLLEISYEYEPVRFLLPATGNEPSRVYIPDFFLEELNIYLEVKGCIRAGFSRKLERFRTRYNDVPLTIIDTGMYKKLRKKFRPLIDNWEKD